MSTTRTIIVPVELTIYEPEPTSTHIFLMEGGGTATVNGEELFYGAIGTGLASYLPEGRAVKIEVKQIIAAALENIRAEASK